jgi:putative ubiquitin-RnfH superfamily antitoxin RatB of RatAB toxin-antitoxin module
VPVDSILIEVVYAEPNRAVAKQYRLDAPATIADALRCAAADPDFQGIDVAQAAVGVFGKAVSADQDLRCGDRVEIYRPLAADPKIARRERARQQAPRRSG